MSIELPVGGTRKLAAKYLDSAGNPTVALPGAPPLTWTVTDPGIATLDTETGPDVTLTAVGALGTSAGLWVSDGTITSAVDTITIVAGAPASLEIVPAA